MVPNTTYVIAPTFRGTEKHGLMKDVTMAVKVRVRDCWGHDISAANKFTSRCPRMPTLSIILTTGHSAVNVPCKRTTEILCITRAFSGPSEMLAPCDESYLVKDLGAPVPIKQVRGYISATYPKHEFLSEIATTSSLVFGFPRHPALGPNPAKTPPVASSNVSLTSPVISSQKRRISVVPSASVPATQPALLPSSSSSQQVASSVSHPSLTPLPSTSSSPSVCHSKRSTAGVKKQPPGFTAYSSRKVGRH